MVTDAVKPSCVTFQPAPRAAIPHHRVHRDLVRWDVPDRDVLVETSSRRNVRTRHTSTPVNDPHDVRGRFRLPL